MTNSEEQLVKDCGEAVRTTVITIRWLVYWNVLVTGLLILTLVMRK